MRKVGARGRIRCGLRDKLHSLGPADYRLVLDLAFSECRLSAFLERLQAFV